MTPKIDTETWEAIINRTLEVEFDWVGVDKLGQLAVFSSFNKAYIPAKVVSSFDKYQQLDKLIDALPHYTVGVLCTARDGQFKDWLSYSSKGLFAYDFQDAHRKPKLGQYDLISKPKEPLTIAKLKASVLQAVPFFDLVFDSDLSFDKLRVCENKNGM
jgi:hypothetical protein